MVTDPHSALTDPHSALTDPHSDGRGKRDGRTESLLRESKSADTW